MGKQSKRIFNIFVAFIAIGLLTFIIISMNKLEMDEVMVSISLQAEPQKSQTISYELLETGSQHSPAHEKTAPI